MQFASNEKCDFPISNTLQEKMRKRDEEIKRIADIKRKAEEDARLAEERASRIQSQPQVYQILTCVFGNQTVGTWLV